MVWRIIANRIVSIKYQKCIYETKLMGLNCCVSPPSHTMVVIIHVGDMSSATVC